MAQEALRRGCCPTESCNAPSTATFRVRGRHLQLRPRSQPCSPHFDATSRHLPTNPHGHCRRFFLTGRLPSPTGPAAALSPAPPRPRGRSRGTFNGHSPRRSPHLPRAGRGPGPPPSGPSPAGPVNGPRHLRPEAAPFPQRHKRSAPPRRPLPRLRGVGEPCPPGAPRTAPAAARPFPPYLPGASRGRRGSWAAARGAERPRPHRGTAAPASFALAAAAASSSPSAALFPSAGRPPAAPPRAAAAAPLRWAGPCRPPPPRGRRELQSSPGGQRPPTAPTMPQGGAARPREADISERGGPRRAGPGRSGAERRRGPPRGEGWATLPPRGKRCLTAPGTGRGRVDVEEESAECSSTLSWGAAFSSGGSGGCSSVRARASRRPLLPPAWPCPWLPVRCGLAGPARPGRGRGPRRWAVPCRRTSERQTLARLIVVCSVLPLPAGRQRLYSNKTAFQSNPVPIQRQAQNCNDFANCFWSILFQQGTSYLTGIPGEIVDKVSWTANGSWPRIDCSSSCKLYVQKYIMRC